MKNIKLLGSGCRNCETTSGEMAMYHEHAVAKRGFSGLMDGVCRLRMMLLPLKANPYP